MSRIHHHPGDDMLVAYAAGSLDEALSLMVATHAALCPVCRARIDEAEAIGGVLVEDMAPMALSDDSLAAVMSRLDEPDPAPRPAASASRVDAATARLIPEPLRSYLPKGLEALPWRSMGPTVKGLELAVSGGAKARLFRIKPGAAMPRHTHNGPEYTMVLAGGFSDEIGHFLRGDIACVDETLLHQPIADEGEPCLCLAVTDAPLRFTGMMPRLLQPFFGI
jgi:putative transcriptional regulator